MKSAVLAACAALMIPVISGLAQAPAPKAPVAPKPLPVVTPDDAAKLEALIGNALSAKRVIAGMLRVGSRRNAEDRKKSMTSVPCSTSSPNSIR